MDEQALIGEFPVPYVFNDTSFIIFPQETVEKLEKDFWINSRKELSTIQYGSDIIGAKS